MYSNMRTKWLRCPMFMVSMVCWRLLTGMYQITATICIIMYAVVNEKVDKPDPWRLSPNLSLYL